MTLSRRAFLKAAGLGAAAAGVGGFSSNPRAAAAGHCINKNAPDQKNSLFEKLPSCCPGEPLADDEMRITFLGTSCIPRLFQQGVSVYVEVGPTYYDEVNKVSRPADYAMFDCGMGVLANYIAAGIPYSRMDKIFLAHLHADHMSELSAIYCFGESADRKSPLYVWGPSKSNWPDPVSGETHEDGLKEILEHFRAVWRWHTESFSFTSNGYAAYDVPTQEDWGTPCELVPVGKYAQYQDPPNDAYALVPIELDWTKKGEVAGDNVAYDNTLTGLKITHFPVIHCRRGSIGYKLEWTPPNHPDKCLSMIYSGDTRPNQTMVEQASGIDVLVHEIVMPPYEWAKRLQGTEPGDWFLQYLTDVQNSSHTTQGAFGYLLTQIDPRPRLTVATHFQAQDDTIESAQASLDAYGIPREAYTFASDFMVLNVTGETIRQRRLEVSRFAFAAPCATAPQPYDIPKYHDENNQGDPKAQIDTTDAIPPGCDTYDENGYWPGAYGEGCFQP
jgi:ribonuclease Z